MGIVNKMAHFNFFNDVPTSFMALLEASIASSKFLAKHAPERYVRPLTIPEAQEIETLWAENAKVWVGTSSFYYENLKPTQMGVKEAYRLYQETDLKLGIVSFLVKETKEEVEKELLELEESYRT